MATSSGRLTGCSRRREALFLFVACKDLLHVLIKLLLRTAPRLESREFRAVRPIVVVLVEPARLPASLLASKDAGSRELERDRQSVRMFASEVVLFNSWNADGSVVVPGDRRAAGRCLGRLRARGDGVSRDVPGCAEVNQ